MSKKPERKFNELDACKNSENNASPGTYLYEMRRKLDQLREIASELYGTPDTTPIGVVLEGDELESVEIYRSKRAKMIHDLNRHVQRLSQEFEQASSRLLDYQERVDQINERIKSVRQSLLNGVEELITPVIQKHANIEEKIRRIGKEQSSEIQDVLTEALKGITAESVVSDTSRTQARKLEEGIQKAREFFEEVIKPRLTDLSNEIDHLLDNASSAVLAQSLADEVTQLKDRESYLVDLAQLGLITETATHEHENHVRKIRESIQELRKNIDAKKTNVVDRLADSFEIVDARMRMFDPLIRKRGVISKILDGKTIEKFLHNHFQEYFDDKTIELTGAFQHYEASSVKVPVFLGAAYNLVHNAVYWCRQGTAGTPKIRISSGAGSLVVSDSGPGVSPKDVLRIFDPGFSRKPYGRGLGLFIARQALKGIGYDLILASETQPGALDGANFIIQKEPTDDNE